MGDSPLCAHRERGSTQAATRARQSHVIGFFHPVAGPKPPLATMRQCVKRRPKRSVYKPADRVAETRATIRPLHEGEAECGHSLAALFRHGTELTLGQVRGSRWQ